MSKFWADSSGSSSSISETSDIRNDDEKSVEKDEIDWHLLSEYPEAAWRELEESQTFDSPVTAQTTTGEQKDVTRIVCMSDTHGRHRELSLPKGDVLIHAGDFTMSGELGTIRDLSAMFEEQSHHCNKIICIAGNHDMSFQEHAPQQSVWQQHRFEPGEGVTSLKNCIYLEDESCRINTENDALTVYGSPWIPDLLEWAFALKRGDALRSKWEQIPEDTDILITHGPPLGRGDALAQGGARVGCLDMLREVQHRVKPRLHIFGHVHEGYGCSYDGQTLFVNASNLDFHYKAVNQCIVIDLPHNKSEPARVVKPQNCQITTKDSLVKWLETNESRYPQLFTTLLENSAELDDIPLGNELLQEDAYQTIVDKLLLYRHRGARDELRKALSQIYADAF